MNEDKEIVTVWLVWEMRERGHFESPELMGVFSAKEVAERYIDQQPELRGGERFWISDSTVDQDVS